MAIPITKKIRDKYDRLFKEDPIKANTFLMFSKKADSTGKITFHHKEETPKEQVIMDALKETFTDIRAYNLPENKSILEKRWR